MRFRWMDVLRGGAIGLVILSHSAFILVRFNYGIAPGWLIAFNEMFAPFRMPTLMFLSGMLLPAALRKPLGVYYSGKLRKVAWPYVVWMVVWCVAFPVYGSLLSLDTWWTSYLWFLLYIFIFYLIAPLTRWVPGWVLVLAPWIAASMVDGLFNRRFFFLMGFFFLGKLVADHSDLLERVMRSRWVWVAVPVTAVFGLYSALVDPTSYWGLLAPVSAVGVLAAAKIAQTIDGQEWTRPLQYIGQHSLIFYVTHFPVIAATSWAGWQFGIPVIVTIVAGFAAALLVGWASVWSSERSWVHVLFVFPQLDRKASSSRLNGS